MRIAVSIFRRRRAQSMVEFALIVPLLLMLMFGIIELGIMFSIYIGMTNSAREAARAGAIYQHTGTPYLSSDPGATAAIDAARKQYISQVLTDTLNPMIDSKTVTVTVTYTGTSVLDPEAPSVYRSGDYVEVSLSHDHPLFFGVLGPQKITIRATSAMRIEPGDAR
jgi:Flp pilus assembly protein TadG